MDIKQMKYFVEVVNQNSMTNASKSLYIAQPTISKAIKDLEKELNMTLFDRSKRQLALTDAGRVFYQKSKEILTLYNDLPREVNSLLGLETGHISIGLSAVMNMNKFIHILGEFHQKYPNVTYNLVENGGKMIETQLIKDELDIGITTIPVDQSIFHSVLLYEEELKLVLNKEHRLANYEQVDMSMLKDEDFILFNEDFYLNDKIIESAKNSGFVPNTISKISQWNFIENLLSAHLGVSILPENIVNLLDGNFKSIKIDDPAMRWELGVIWKRDKYLSHATKKWIEFMKQRL
ncbi:MAG: LysR substrate-binding domain-containing protein [Staphylococcus equorum]|uniref:cidABC operon transcriptional activator CidR n=1 Tax=Staphylococcus TaxID=1279 RepID=UPI00085311A6|nr:LysR family transcriptional regulator [Staphylococcus equorum]MDG0822814.1 LysR substrate-binding domain-containing protein [Staphylococcus equorum]MDG0836686.1 LysR substrate-binding domain-containing protein [Staphylococcus equorum]MDK9871278.1 LysR substrate-binding domain-containing protein [Staphylococcus equorum]MDK9877677.1 LysR substrate-binding domain-containing protein [Staphylococcus equorum]MDN5828461.1 LysR substrate-binding domain-containing protein [Staphylococcus equorum]